MRLLSKDDEGGITLIDWDDGFVGLNRRRSDRKPFAFHFERWSCCPGSLEISLELLGVVLVAYNEGGPCQLENFLDAWEDEPSIELVKPDQAKSRSKAQDWRTIPTPASR